jgi:hypothetical protein
VCVFRRVIQPFLLWNSSVKKFAIFIKSMGADFIRPQKKLKQFLQKKKKKKKNYESVPCCNLR